ncbi:TIR domain-containing protein [Micromonospora sp. SCSIO 07396]
MEDLHVGAFWSYAHEDDRLDLGRIRNLAQRIMDEYSLITGEELDIFVDRSGIQWGHAWRARIDAALGATTFFIPVLSPRYFTRDECRKELISFNRRAQATGVAESLLPILYAPIPNLTSENPDELVALASRYQYVDWTDNRLASEDSPEYRRAVHELAKRLTELSSSIGARLVSKEIAIIDDADEDAGIFDRLESVMQLLPDWLESVESSETNEAQFEALIDILLPRIEALENRPGQGQARLAVLQRLAKEGMPLAQRHLEASAVYVRRSMELDPLITSLVQAASNHPDARDILDEVHECITKAERGITKASRTARGMRLDEWLRTRAHLSRLANQLTRTVEAANKNITEGNAIVARWLLEWRDLPLAPSVISEAPSIEVLDF